jgi:hypothetical protein
MALNPIITTTTIMDNEAAMQSSLNMRQDIEIHDKFKNYTLSLYLLCVLYTSFLDSGPQSYTEQPLFFKFAEMF